MSVHPGPDDRAHGPGATGVERRDPGRSGSDDVEITLCVLLWAREGQEDGLADYEDHALTRLVANGGRVLSRWSGAGASGAPHEVQLVRFPDQRSYETFLDDPARRALSGMRDRVVARTEVFRAVVGPDERGFGTAGLTS